MTQLPDVSSRRTRGLDAALRAIGFVLWFSFILFCVGLNQSTGLASADDAFFAVTAKSLASGLGYATTFPVFSKEIGHPILFFPGGSGPTLIVPCAIAFKIFGKNEVLPGLTAILTWGSVLTLVLARISRRIDGLSFLLGVSVMCAALPSLSSHTGSYQTSDSRRHRHFCAVSRLGARSRQRFSPQSPRRALSWYLLLEVCVLASSLSSGLNAPLRC